MYRDVSSIADYGSCYVIDTDSIIAFDPATNYRYEFKNVSEKYYLYRQTVYDTIDSGVSCHTYYDIQSIPSKYDFVVPIYHTIAIASALLLFYFAYRLIIYPFFKKV